MPKGQPRDTNSRMVLFPLSMLGHKHILKVQKRSFTKERYATTCQMTRSVDSSSKNDSPKIVIWRLFIWLCQMTNRPRTISLCNNYSLTMSVDSVSKNDILQGLVVRRLDQWTMSVDQSSHDDPLQNLRFDTIYHPCYSLRIILRAPRGQHVMGT